MTTGHRVSPVAPRCRVVPALKGSVLLCLTRTDICDGVSRESTAMSLTVSMEGVNAEWDGRVNSAARMKPKNPRQKAAQSMTLS